MIDDDNDDNNDDDDDDDCSVYVREMCVRMLAYMPWWFCVGKKTDFWTPLSLIPRIRLR